MARRQRAGKGVVVVALPVELPRRRANHHGSIGNAWANDDVSTLIQRLLDAPAAQIGVRSKRRLIRVPEILLGIKVGERFAIAL